MINRLVLLPGMDGTGELFAGFVAALPTEIETTVVRYPPHQPSTYADLFSLVSDSTSGLEHFVVLGESFSAPLAVRLAALRPRNLAGLVICVGFVRNPLPNWEFLIKVLARPTIFRLPLPHFVLEYYLTGPAAPSDLKQKVHRAVRAVSPRVLAGRVREILGCDVREDLARVKVPIMYLQATGDRLVGSRCFDEIRKIHPCSVLVSFPGPHMILQREPHLCANAVVEFCSSIQRGR